MSANVIQGYKTQLLYNTNRKSYIYYTLICAVNFRHRRPQKGQRLETIKSRPRREATSGEGAVVSPKNVLT